MALTKITDKQVTYKQVGAGSVVRSLGDRLRDVVTIYDFGAVGDGIVDDTASVLAAIQHGGALDWCDGVYRITGTVSATLTEPFNWLSSGAKVFVDPSTPVRNAVQLYLPAGASRLDGKFTIDANRKCFIGFQIENTTTDPDDKLWSDFYADGLSVKNIYRSSSLFNGGSGINIRGSFRQITLVAPSVENCAIATGTAEFGVNGMAGILITVTSSNNPRSVTVIDPFIDTVYSEDIENIYDQDGIIYIGTPSITDSDETYFKVIGGTLKNCYGRSIKSQCEHTTVTGTTFVRTAGFTRGYGNEEIDFQNAAGTVRDITCIYNGSASSRIVRFVPARSGKLNYSSYGIVDGIECIVHTGTFLPKVVMFYIPDDDTWTENFNLRVSNVEVVNNGTVDFLVELDGRTAAGGTPVQVNLLLTDCVGKFDGSAWVLGKTSYGTCRVKASRLINLLPTKGYISTYDATTFIPEVSASDCVNFVIPKNLVNTARPHGVYQRIGAFAADDAPLGGLFRPLSFQIADGASYQLPFHGYTNVTCTLLIATNLGRSAQGLFGIGSDGVTALTPDGTLITAGLLVEPASGAIRIWSSGAAAGAMISNHSGGLRTITCMLIG